MNAAKIRPRVRIGDFFLLLSLSLCCSISQMTKMCFYFGGARSKGFVTLRNVLKLIFLGQDWGRKVCRVFGFIRLFDEVRADLVRDISRSLRLLWCTL